MCTVKPPIKDTPKEDRPPNKGRLEMLLYTHSVQNNLQKRTTSLQGTQWLVPMHPALFGGSTVLGEDHT